MPTTFPDLDVTPTVRAALSVLHLSTEELANTDHSLIRTLDDEGIAL